MPKKPSKKPEKKPPHELPKAFFPVLRKRMPALVIAPEGRHISGWIKDAEKRHELKGKQALPTERVKMFAERFPGKDMKTIQAILLEMKKLKKVPLPLDQLKHFYVKRTAEDILAHKNVVILNKKERTRTGLRILGCNDYALAMIGILRANGIEAMYCWDPRRRHARVLVEVEGKPYLADPAATAGEGIKKPIITKIDPYEFGLYVKEYDVRIGEDSWDVEIFSVEDTWGDVLAKKKKS